MTACVNKHTGFFFFCSASFLVAQFNPHATHEPACLRNSSPPQTVSQSSLGGGGSLRLPGLCCLIFLILCLFFSFLSSSVRGNEKDFCCMTAACNVSAASSSCICSCCASLCHLFFLCVWTQIYLHIFMFTYSFEWPVKLSVFMSAL